MENLEFRELVEKIMLEITKLSNPSVENNIIRLQNFLLQPDPHPYLRDLEAILVPLALLQHGEKGLKALADLLYEVPRRGFRSAVFGALWSASKGEVTNSLPITVKLPQDSLLLSELPTEVKTKAKILVEEIAETAVIDDEIFDAIINTVWRTNFLAKPPLDEESRSEILRIFTASSIKISSRLIKEFRNLIGSNEKEEVYQVFLSKNPVFLDPLASEVIAKQKLGIEHITDFVVRRYDGGYILVEIEKPQDALFTQTNDFSSHFTHAYGQVLDFQGWVETHAEYARSLMPGIASPEGLLVMGRRTDLNQDNIQKLNLFQANSAHIKIATFDDLLANGENLYKNIYKHAKESTG